MIEALVRHSFLSLSESMTAVYDGSMSYAIKEMLRLRTVASCTTDSSTHIIIIITRILSELSALQPSKVMRLRQVYNAVNVH